MPFGQMNAPFTFQRMMGQLCADFLFARVYIDSVVIFSQTMEEHLDHLEESLEKLSKYNINVKVSKYHFAQPEIKLLGHVIDENGVYVDPEKIGKLLNIPSTTMKIELQSFLRVEGCYCRFINNLADMSAPLHAATSVTHDFKWK